jgi:hypothetical protein
MFGWQYPGCVVWRSPLIWRYITVFNDGKYASLDLVERIGHIQKKKSYDLAELFSFLYMTRI